MKEEVIKFNSAKINRNLGIGTLILILSSYLLLKATNDYNGIYVIIGVAGLAIFIPKVIFALAVKLTKRKFLTINKDGITDTSELYSVGFMSWKDIQEINIKGKNSNKVVEIHLKNMNEVMTKMPWHKRMMLRVSRMVTKSAIVINFDYSDNSFDEAVKILDKNTRQYMRRKVQYKSIY